MLKPLGDRVVLKVEEKEQKVKDGEEKYLVVNEANILAIVE